MNPYRSIVILKEPLPLDKHRERSPTCRGRKSFITNKHIICECGFCIEFNATIRLNLKDPL